MLEKAFNFLHYFVWLRITDDGSVHEIVYKPYFNYVLFKIVYSSYSKTFLYANHTETR